MITKEMWVDWKKNPVTVEFLMALREKREMLKEGLAENQTGVEREDCITIGKCQALKDVIEYATRYFDYTEIENGPSGDRISDSVES